MGTFLVVWHFVSLFGGCWLAVLGCGVGVFAQVSVHDGGMQCAYSSEQVRAAELPLLERGVPLMARASFALYQFVSRVVESTCGALAGTRVVFLVGPGNNGGDALFAAAHLAKRPAHVTVVLASSAAHVDGLAAVRGTQARVVSLAEAADLAQAQIFDEVVALVRSADVVVDGLLGIGATGVPRGPIGALLEAIQLNELRMGPRPSLDAVLERTNPVARPIVVAVDVPSGVNATSGAVDDARRVVAADFTVTFGAMKAGLVLAPGALYSGLVELIDIGLDLDSLAPALRRVEPHDFGPAESLRFLVGTPSPAAHKYTRGVAGVIAGSVAYPGAGILATGAAQNSGIGMVRYCGANEVAQKIASLMPEVVPAQGRVQAWLVGSGMEPNEETRRRVEEVVHSGLPAVLDAGALAVLDAELVAQLKPHHVLTPHAGELADLLGRLVGNFTRETVEADLLKAAQTLQAHTGATIVAKGPRTVIVGETETYVDAGGNSRLATAGSGDVLAGIIVAALACAHSKDSNSKQTNERIVAAAVMIHTNAGNVASHTAEILNEGQIPSEPHPITASAIVAAIPHVHAKLAAQHM